MDTLTSLASADRPVLQRSSRLWIWSFPLAFVVHDAEEVIATVRAGELKSFGAPLTVSQGLAAILFELALFWLISVLAVWSGQRSWQTRIFGALLAGYTLHGLVHLGAAIVGTGYVFGAITALPAVIVYGSLALYRLHSEHVLTRRDITWGFTVSAVAGAPFMWIVHEVGKIIG